MSSVIYSKLSEQCIDQAHFPPLLGYGLNLDDKMAQICVEAVRAVIHYIH